MTSDPLGAAVLDDHPGLAARLLTHWISGGTKLAGVRKMVFGSLVRELDSRYYSRSSSVEERERLKALCMGRDSAVQWARQYLKRGFPEPQTAFLPMFARLEEALQSVDSISVHQVGCCSGREIAHFAARFPGSRFVGSDCDENLILFLRQTWQHLPNLSFDLVRLENESDILQKISCDLLVASGGFHYLDGEVLRRFFQTARGLAQRIFLSQPLDEEYQAGLQSASSPRRQMSWNHPYPSYLKSAGWSRIEWMETAIEGTLGVKNIAAFAST